MSYYATFKPSKEVMEKYNHEPKNNNYFLGQKIEKPDLTPSRLAILIETLAEPENKNNFSVFNTIKTLKFEFNHLKYVIKEEEEQFAYDRWKDEEDGSLWYCGWKFAKDAPDIDYEELESYVIENLIILKYCVPTGNYYDKETNFHDKRQEVNELIEHFIDTCRDIEIFRIMDELKDFREKDDDDDDDLNMQYNETKQDATKIVKPFRTQEDNKTFIEDNKEKVNINDSDNLQHEINYGNENLI